jgi:hypothetical protein
MNPDTIRAQILAARDFKLEPVSAPEWGFADGSIFVRSFSGKSRAKIEAYISSKSDKDGAVKGDVSDLFATVVQLSLCTEDGALIFPPESIPQLSEKDAVILQRLFNQAFKLNRLSAEAVQEARETFQSKS